MLNRPIKSEHITDRFIEPYFIQTDSSGIIIAICRKFAVILSGFGINGASQKNLCDVFSRISNSSVAFGSNIRKKGFPETFDLCISLSKAKSLTIRWMANRMVTDQEQPFEGWQLTGMELHALQNGSDLSQTQDAGGLRQEKIISEAIVKSFPGVFYLFDNKGKYLRWNKQLELISGYNAAEISNMKPEDFVRDDEKPYIKTIIEKVFETGSAEAEANLLTKDGRRIPYYFTGCLIEIEGKPCLTGAGINIAQLRKAEQLLALEKEVLQINSDQQASLQTTIDCFLSGIEKIFPDMICSVLLLDEDGVSIRPLSSPGLPLIFSETINGLLIGPTSGSCGAAMYFKRRIIVDDISTDPLWKEYKQIALRFNLHACWSLPIINAQNEVLASFATYYKFSKKPTEEELTFIDRAANLIRIIIENKKAEEKIKISHERYVLATKATNDAIWDWDIKSGYCFWGEGLYTQFGHMQFPEIYGKLFWETHIHPSDRQRIIDSREEFIITKSRAVWCEEYRFLKADGKYALVSDRGFLVFDKEERVTRVIGSMQDITIKKGMEKKILKQELTRQKLIGQTMINTQEKERAEIGKELHDNVNQILSTGKLYLELAKTNEGERKNLLEICSLHLNDAINEIRKISRALVPSSIDDVGLQESIRDMVEQVNAKEKINVEFYAVNWSNKHIENAQKLTLFRIIQEQVNNVLKHADANNLIIELEMDENAINLNIADDGKGFDPERIKAGKTSAFSNIIYRADLLDGDISIVSAPGKGCKLTVQIPIYNSHLNIVYE